MIERLMSKKLKKKKKKVREKANRKRFTEDNVIKLPAKRKQYLVWDEGTDAARGLAILVSPTGTRSYRCVFYYPGSPKPHYMHLARVGEMSLAEARNRCRVARGTARGGDDPRAGEATRSDNFKAAVEYYIEDWQIGHCENKSALETQKVMLNSCTAWHGRPVATLRYQEIEKLLANIRGVKDAELRARPYLANRLYSHLRDFFGWCARKKMVAASPMADMPKPWDKEKPRERIWFKKRDADKAIKAIWKAADEVEWNEGRYLKLLLLTGKRKTALSLMDWKQIDSDWFWDAPKSTSKNKRLHGVPLSKFAQRVIGPRQKEGKVFAGEIEFDRLQYKVRKLTGISDFIFHGVRHLVETKTAELRDEDNHSLIPPHIRDVLFDHAPNRGSGKGYDHHDYIPEMRAAMELWSDYVAKLVEAAQGVARLR